MKTTYLITGLIAAGLLVGCNNLANSNTNAVDVSTLTGEQIAKKDMPFDKKLSELKLKGYSAEEIKELLKDCTPVCEKTDIVNKLSGELGIKTEDKIKFNNNAGDANKNGLAKCIAYPYCRQVLKTFTPQIVFSEIYNVPAGQTFDAYTLTPASSIADPYIVVLSDVTGSYNTMQTFNINASNDDAFGYGGGKTSDAHVAFTSTASKDYTILVFAFSESYQGTSRLLVNVNGGNTEYDADIAVKGYAIGDWTGGRGNWVFTTDPQTVTGNEDPIVTVFNFETGIGVNNDDFNYHWRYCMDLGSPCNASWPADQHSNFPSGNESGTLYQPLDGNSYASSICTNLLSSCYNGPSGFNIRKYYNIVLLWGVSEGGSVDYYQYGARLNAYLLI